MTSPRRPLVALLIAMLAGCTANGSQTAAINWRTAELSTTHDYDGETYDFGVRPISTIRTSDVEAPTPLRIAEATTVTTRQLRDMMMESPPPVLIDVIAGTQTTSLPGAIWLRGGGGVEGAGGIYDALQPKFVARLATFTNGDKAKPIVFFCLSKTCWLSHNAVVRAVAAGYSRVYWYRGGREAWQIAGLPLTPVPMSNLAN
jgi:PQQ-dependent catabolism-associated CXXCW motif protein